MIKKMLVLVFVLMLAGVAFADDTIHKADGQVQYISQVMTLSADAGPVALGDNLCGGYIYTVEINATADDVMTFSIASRHGTVFYTTTTSAAIAGEIETVGAFYPLNCDKGASDYPTYTLSDLGSGTVTIETTVVKK